MTDAAPTVTARSAAICGNSESAERTIDWLANPAATRSPIARVCGRRGNDGDGAGNGAAGTGVRGAGRGRPIKTSGPPPAHAPDRGPARHIHAGRAYDGDVDSQGSRRLYTARTKAIAMIDNRYQPAEIEARISTRWEEAGAVRAGRRPKAKPYCIGIPPPNVTGSLHMGHALNNTLQDVLCRFERMRGRDVLWQPGTDHAGIATQMVVERQMMERQEPGRRDIGRDKFLEKVWAWKAESGGIITGQLRRLGASCDWSRERFTMDEGLSRAVLKVFVDLYKADLIYKDKRLVNWDPKLLTAISDLEVQQVEVKGSLW